MLEWTFLALLVATLACLVGAERITNGPGSADERTGGTILLLPAGVFGAAALVVLIISLFWR